MLFVNGLLSLKSIFFLFYLVDAESSHSVLAFRAEGFEDWRSNHCKFWSEQIENLFGLDLFYRWRAVLWENAYMLVSSSILLGIFIVKLLLAPHEAVCGFWLLREAAYLFMCWYMKFYLNWMWIAFMIIGKNGWIKFYRLHE